MTVHKLKFYLKREAPKAKPKTDFNSINSTKLMYHPIKVAEVLQADTWDKYKSIVPIYAECSPLNFCPHSCEFCGVDYAIKRDAKIDPEVFKVRIKELGELGLKSLMMAGEGEPLLHKSIVEMTLATKAAGIAVSFTTNGLLMTTKFIEGAMAATSWIKVSFNAASPETYAKVHGTTQKDFHTVCTNIKNAVEYKKQHNLDCDIGMQLVLIESNAHEVEDFVKLAKSLAVDYAVVKRYNQHKFSNTRENENTDYSKYEYLSDVLSKYNDDTFSVVFRQNSDTEQTYSECRSLPLWVYIDSNMDVYNCSAYLLQPDHNLGNLKEQTFKEIWQGEKRRKLFEEGIDISGCRSNCRMDSCNRFLDSIANSNIKNVNFI